MEIAVLLLLTVPLTAATPLRPTYRSVKDISKYAANDRREIQTVTIMMHHPLPANLQMEYQNLSASKVMKEFRQKEENVRKCLIDKYRFLMDPQVRHRLCPPRGHCPGFRGEKVRGHTGAACKSTEDHPISLRRQTSQPGHTETQVQHTT